MIDSPVIEKENSEAGKNSSRSEIKSRWYHYSNQLINEVDTFSTAIEKEMRENAITIDKFNNVMSFENFVKNTTTKEFFIETTRKTIKPVDEAIKAYHANKSDTTLENLLSKINNYVSSNKSKRIPYVLLLEPQVELALGK